MARKIIGGAITSMPHNENYKELYEKIDGAQSVINQARDATNKADAAAANANTAASNANTARSNALQAANIANQAAQNANTAMVNVENKMSDIENRWSNLTTAKQEDAEVIDARTSTAKGKTFNNINERFEEIEEEIVDATYTPELTNQSLIFGVGTGYDKNGNYIDLNDKVTKGQVSASVKGNTYTNIIKNGSFENDDDNWRFSHAGTGQLIIDEVERVMGQKSAKISNQTSEWISLNQTLALNPDDYYILTCYVKVLPGTLGASIRLRAGNTNIHVLNISNTSWERKIIKFKANSIDTVIFGSTGSFNGTMWIDGVQINKITLEEFNTLSDDQLLSKYTYITDTKSTVGAVRIKSVGKNLFGATLEDGGILDGSGNNGIVPDRFRTKEFIKTAGNTQYVISAIKAERVYFYDRNKNYIGYEAGPTSFMTPVNCRYVRFRFVYSQNPDGLNTQNIQLERNGTATKYEPYKESNAYVIATDKDTGKILELRSLPNGTKDEIRVTDNKLIKRVSDEVVLDGSENWTYSGSTEQVDVYTVANWASVYNCVEITSYKNQDAIVATSKENKITIESTWNVETWSEDADIGIHTYNNDLHIIAKKHLGLTTTAMLKQYLEQYPITLTYQLAEPVEMPIEIEGDLMSYPNGTIYIDPYIANMYSYNNGILLDYPVTQIDKLMGFVDGVWQELDNTYNLSPDGKTLTIADIDNNDKIKVYAPIRPEESTVPETTHVVPLNIAAQIHDVVVKSSQNTVKLSQHDSMLLGLALSYIDLDIRIKALEVV